MEKMPAVVNFEARAGAVELREISVPEIGDRDVLLRVRGVGVCGSDVHQYHDKHSWKQKIPVVLGHEFGGEIAKVGSAVTGFAPGDRVVSETAAQIDEASPMVREGRYNLDPHRLGYGALIDGAMARYVKVPARCLHRIPKEVSDEVAALTEPCCVAYQATVVNSRVKPGDAVVVIGPGPIGLLCAQMARLCGAGSVILAGIGRDRVRMDLGLKTGATHAVDTQKDDLGKLLAGLGDGLGADLVIDSAGHSATLKSALAWVRPGGHITKVGWGPQPLDFSLDPLVQKAVTLQGSFSHTWAVWERVLRLLASGQLDVKPLISKVAPLEGWKECFDGMGDGALLKAVLKPT